MGKQYKPISRSPLFAYGLFFVWFDSLRPSKQTFGYVGMGPVLFILARINVSCSIQTRGPSVSSQALYHWATALPTYKLFF